VAIAATPGRVPQAKNKGAASSANPTKVFVFRATIHSSLTWLPPGHAEARQRLVAIRERINSI